MQKKKSLGQHFLHSSKIISDIVLVGKILPNDTVLEIGPGEGSLTEKLLPVAGKVIAVEKDSRLIPMLQEKFREEIKSGKLKLIEGDILEYDIESLVAPDLDEFRGGKAHERGNVLMYDDESVSLSNKEIRQRWSYKLIANIPYYITGQILRMFLETKNQPETMVLLMQKEVAERILARDGKGSLLSLSVKAFGEPKLVRTVGRGSFSPPPNVDSAILLIQNISRFHLDGIPEKFFFKVLHAGFAHKRKQLLPNLSLILPKEKLVQAFEKAGISLQSRAEDIPLETWLTLSKLLRSDTMAI